MLFFAVVNVLDIFVRAIIGVFAGMRTMIVGILSKIPGADLFIQGLDSVVNVSVVTSNIAIIISIVAGMFSVWGLMKIINLIRG